MNWFKKCVCPFFFLFSFLLFGCSNVLVQESSGGIEVPLSISDDSGRMASMRSVSTSISLSHHVEGWIENQQGERLQTVEKDFSGSTVLSFQQMKPGTVARVFVKISSRDIVQYSGKSDFFTVSRRGNHVSVTLKYGDFPVEDSVSPVTSGDSDSTPSDSGVSPGDSETVPSDSGSLPGDAATISFDPSWITVTVSSRDGARANTVTAQGSASNTSVTHNFYGITGSQVQFSLSQKAIDAGMSLYINRGNTTGYASTKFDQEPGTVQYAVQIQRSSETSSWYYFNVTSEMKPVTVTFTGVDYNYSSKSNETPNINIYNGFTVGGNVAATGNMSFTTGYGGNEIVSLYSGLNYAVTASSTTWETEVRVSDSSSIKFDDGTTTAGWKQTYTLSQLWGNSSIVWGTYFRLNYTISQP